MNRRNLLLSGMAVGPIGLGLAACGGDKRESAIATVRIIGEDSSNLQAIAAHLIGDHRKQTFPSTVEATDFATASAKAITAFTRGSSAYDIVLGYNFDLPRYVENNYVFNIDMLKKGAGSANLSYEFESDLLPNVWRELGHYLRAPYDDLQSTQAVAYPFAANTMVMVCSEQVFADPKVKQAYRQTFGHDFRPPVTWDELSKVANLVASANDAFKGVCLQGAGGGWLYYEWMNFLFGLGGAVMDKAYGWQSNLTTPLTLRTVEAARAAELYLGLKPVNSGDFFGTDAVGQRDEMLKHKTAFAIMWTDYVPQLAAAGGFIFAPIPGDRSMIAGGSFFVNRKSDAPAASLAMIAHLLSKPVQKELAIAGLFPPTRSALADPDVLAKPYMPAVRTSLERGVYMLEAGPDSSLISDKITETLQKAWRGDIAAKEVGAHATRLIEANR